MQQAGQLGGYISLSSDFFLAGSASSLEFLVVWMLSGYSKTAETAMVGYESISTR